MSLNTDKIFDLFPAYLRLKDFKEGQRVKSRVAPGDDRLAENFGPLRTLASLVAREGQIVDEQLEQLYANAFIETCEPWVIPYLAELLGVRGLADIPEGIEMRARVADALQLRSRKGTLRALELAAAQASNWPIVAVEYGKRLVHAQSLRLVHTNQGASVNFRDKAALSRVGTPFDRISRNVEVRRIESMKGRWNIGNIGLHVWRLRPYSLTCHRVNSVGSGRRDFRFHPLGCDAQLFDRVGLREEAEISMLEEQMPLLISREIMAENLEHYYGPGKAINLNVGGTCDDKNNIPLSEIKVAHLGDRSGGGNEPPWNRKSMLNKTLIDPELGRIVVGQNHTGAIRISCHFARPFDIGGGEQSRETSIGSLEEGKTVLVSKNIVQTIVDEGGSGVFLLEQSTHYSASGNIQVPANTHLKIVSTDGHFPTIRITNELKFSLGNDATVELNGLRFFNAPIVVSGEGNRMEVKDCTFTPGISLDRLGNPIKPRDISLEILNRGLSLSFSRCVSGPIIVDSDVDAHFIETILDGGSKENIAFGVSNASSRSSVSFDRCTIYGKVETDMFQGKAQENTQNIKVQSINAEKFATSDTIFCGKDLAVLAKRQQVGCIRFSYVPPNSQPPRLFRCISSTTPRFTSVRYVDSSYFLLSLVNEDTLLKGAENGGEMGTYNGALHESRGGNIKRTISDFLRFGYSAGVFYEN